MTWPNKLNPITVLHMLYNLTYKAGHYGHSLGIAFIPGNVIGVPDTAGNKNAFRNLLNKAIVLSPDNNNPVLLVYLNPDPAVPGFNPPSHDEEVKVLNSFFVLVQDDPNDVPRVAVNISLFNAPDPDLIVPPVPTTGPTAAPTPSPTPTT
jgi:hypothetical protein